LLDQRKQSDGREDQSFLGVFSAGFWTYVALHPEPSAPDLLSVCLSAGAGESGKSTIVKQMRILHVDGFNAE